MTNHVQIIPGYSLTKIPNPRTDAGTLLFVIGQSLAYGTCNFSDGVTKCNEAWKDVLSAGAPPMAGGFTSILSHAIALHDGYCMEINRSVGGTSWGRDWAGDTGGATPILLPGDVGYDPNGYIDSALSAYSSYAPRFRKKIVLWENAHADQGKTASYFQSSLEAMATWVMNYLNPDYLIVGLSPAPSDSGIAAAWGTVLEPGFLSALSTWSSNSKIIAGPNLYRLQPNLTEPDDLFDGTHPTPHIAQGAAYYYYQALKNAGALNP